MNQKAGGICSYTSCCIWRKLEQNTREQLWKGDKQLMPPFGPKWRNSMTSMLSNCSQSFQLARLKLVLILKNYSFSDGTAVKNPPGYARDVSSIPGLGRSPGVGNGNSLHYSRLENRMHRGVWWAEVRGVTRVGYNWACAHASNTAL